ncbi:DUF5304 family protein [Streptomyces albidus (ex Kaewkla and Franco 2022)]|uniref:DUF5304 family protein n=1 Tax=Streptomyces albidus (ex Kaewkla and Franco 2022) TaxID=722709 RepID=UPI0015EE6108|nr:DUF5304 family protein [Streptomyces albidus (ex Kaewkla and Franco 2022)]
MSDAAQPPASDDDAWAKACEEDLAAEKARRRAESGQQYGSPAEELRRLADAVSERVAELGKPFAGTVASAAAQGVAQQLIAQAKAAIEPVVERNPQVFDHLAAAGGELLAAYRSAVQEAEGRWTAGTSAPSAPDTAGEGRDAAPAGLERIDLDKDPGERTEPGGSAKPEPHDGGESTSGPESSGGSGSTDGPDDPYGPGGRSGGPGTGSGE